MTNNFLKKHTKGFTLIEIIVVIAIIAILTGIISPSLASHINKTRIKVDNKNLQTLNRTSSLYSALKKANAEDIFEGVSTDGDINRNRMQILVDEGFLDKIVKAQQKKFKFEWNIENQIWNLSSEDGDDPGPGPGPGKFNVKYDNSGGKDSLKISDLIGDANVPQDKGWSKGPNGELIANPSSVISQDKMPRLFVKNNNEEYTITSTAKISSLLGSGAGYGIFFESSLDENNKDTGYAVHYNKLDKEIVIRKRENGKEVATNLTKIPINKNNDWWNSEHEIKLDVTAGVGEGNQKVLDIYIDNIKVGASFEFEGNSSPGNNYTGFRSWGIPPTKTTFTGLEIKGK